MSSLPHHILLPYEPWIATFGIPQAADEGPWVQEGGIWTVPPGVTANLVPDSGEGPSSGPHFQHYDIGHSPTMCGKWHSHSPTHYVGIDPGVGSTSVGMVWDHVLTADQVSSFYQQFTMDPIAAFLTHDEASETADSAAEMMWPAGVESMDIPATLPPGSGPVVPESWGPLLAVAHELLATETDPINSWQTTLYEDTSIMLHNLPDPTTEPEIIDEGGGPIAGFAVEDSVDNGDGTFSAAINLNPPFISTGGYKCDVSFVAEPIWEEIAPLIENGDFEW
jgi:hypothetical protein